MVIAKDPTEPTSTIVKRVALLEKEYIHRLKLLHKQLSTSRLNLHSTATEPECQLVTLGFSATILPSDGTVGTMVQSPLV